MYLSLNQPEPHHFDFALLPCCARGAPTVCVTCVWAGVDSAWKQEKTRSEENA